MPNWAKAIARDLGLALLVFAAYIAGSLMLGMLLAALLGTSLD